MVVSWNSKRALKRACPGVKPGTSRTQSKNHATRPTGQTYGKVFREMFESANPLTQLAL